MSFLQIGTWNIEHLSGHSRATRAQSAFALADHIEMAGIDLLALQEIYVTDAAEVVKLAENQPEIPSHAREGRRNSDLDVVCHLLEEHLDETEWRYQILPNRSPGDTSQLCAVLWNTRRLTLDAVTALEVSHDANGYKLWDRKPHLLSFSSEIPVWRKSVDGTWTQLAERRSLSIVPLHMKANTSGPTISRIVRGLEAATLCDALYAAKGTYDPSLIMLGDTNILRNDEPALEHFVTRGFVDLNNNDATTYWSKQYGESPFDRILVAEGRREFKYSRQYVLRSSDLEKHDQYLSDHYMVKVSVKDYVDESDPRLADS